MASERFDDFVRFAIDREIEAAALYEKYATVASARSSRELLLQMAVMERGHEAKLRGLLATGKGDFARPGTVDDLHLSDFIVECPVNDATDLQGVFLFAIQAEQKACALYTRLARLEEETETRELFAVLAAEEQQHKHDLEVEYERQFMSEN